MRAVIHGDIVCPHADKFLVGTSHPIVCSEGYETLSNNDLEFLNHARKCLPSEPFESAYKKWRRSICTRRRTAMKHWRRRGEYLTALGVGTQIGRMWSSVYPGNCPKLPAHLLISSYNM